MSIDLELFKLKFVCTLFPLVTKLNYNRKLSKLFLILFNKKANINAR